MRLSLEGIEISLSAIKTKPAVARSIFSDSVSSLLSKQLASHGKEDVMNKSLTEVVRRSILLVRSSTFLLRSSMFPTRAAWSRAAAVFDLALRMAEKDSDTESDMVNRWDSWDKMTGLAWQYLEPKWIRI